MSETNQIILRVLFTVVGMILSGAVHEWAHAIAALKLGDRTAENEGRVTLNPAAHIDPLGTLLFPGVFAVMGGALFGWAKPVPYRPTRFTRKVTIRQGVAIVALAGPLSNVVLAFICALLMKVMYLYGGSLHYDDGGLNTVGALFMFCNYMVLLNMALFLFNLVPVAPLDGFRILETFVDARNSYARFVNEHQMTVFIVFILVAARLLSEPIHWLHGNVLALVGVG